jgi:hypothetical protein
MTKYTFPKCALAQCHNATRAHLSWIMHEDTIPERVHFSFCRLHALQALRIFKPYHCVKASIILVRQNAAPNALDTGRSTAHT